MVVGGVDCEVKRLLFVSLQLVGPALPGELLLISPKRAKQTNKIRANDDVPTERLCTVVSSTSFPL